MTMKRLFTLGALLVTLALCTSFKASASSHDKYHFCHNGNLICVGAETNEYIRHWKHHNSNPNCEFQGLCPHNH
jgi:hypothetical protein